ncbi:hypothetical protein Lal_00011362 [Lupinus albus]|nr:hypothetical protein Lal_00011362 [Lupinus albus]
MGARIEKWQNSRVSKARKRPGWSRFWTILAWASQARLSELGLARGELPLAWASYTTLGCPIFMAYTLILIELVRQQSLEGESRRDESLVFLGEDILLDRTVLIAQTRQSLTTPRFAIVIDEKDAQKAFLRHRPIMDSSFGTDRSFILARMLFYFGAYNRLGMGPMDGNSTRIRRYHFPISQTGAWEIEGDRYTYTGPCGLELELVCRETSMWLPQHHAYLKASFTLPPREPTPVAPEAHDTTFRRTAEAGPSTRKRTWQDYLDAPAYRRAVRRSMPPGTTCRRTLPDPPSSSSEPMEDESTEIEAEADADEDRVIELVNIESSIEVIELSSDSGTKEDPSECSSTPSSAVSSR